MLRRLQVPRLAQKTITIRVDYLVRVISLLFLIGVLTSCVPEEDAVESSSSGGSASLGDAQILWGHSTSSEVTFSTPFTEKPEVIVSSTQGYNYCTVARDNTTTTKFQVNRCSSFSWQAIGR